MKELLRNFWLDESGQDVPEYALMLVLVLLVALGAIIGIGNSANTIFTNVNKAMQNGITASS